MTLPRPPPGERQSGAELAAAYLRGLIFDGTLPPGTRIPQEQVAEAMGLSRIPVREALAMLAAEGRVTIELNRGAFVNTMDEHSVHEAMELVNMVSDFVLRRAIEHDEPSFKRDVRALRRRLRGARRPDEIDPVLRDMRDLIYRAGTSPRVYAALRHVLTLTPYNFTSAFPAALKIQKAAWDEIAKAITMGDADLASQVWAKAAAETNEIVLEALRTRGVIPPATAGSG